MESTVEIEPSAVRSAGIGVKRLAAEDCDALRSNPKRTRVENELNLAVKRVAEIVLVLAAMGRMRGGEEPTESEKELMEEARKRLVEVCEGFAPKDVFPRDGFGGVIEDLGLDKLEEEKMRSRPPKISIVEKFLMSKRKMEKAEVFSLPSTPQSLQQPQRTSGTLVESYSASHSQMSQLAKPSHMLISSGNFQSVSPLGHVTTSNSTPLPYQLPTSEIRPLGSGALPSRHLGSAALPRVDRPNLRSDGGSNGPFQPSRVPANYSAKPIVRTPTGSLQPQSVFSGGIGSDNKFPVNASLKIEGAADIKSGMPSKAASQASLVGNNHADIRKIVQKLLEPGMLEPLSWNPPSRDYMSKALTCQMCMSTDIEIDNILICDGCEKGYHLKCLQMTNQKGVSQEEWNCGKCLSLSNGKPLPPKYGRVMRNASSSSFSSNSAPDLSNSIKNVGASGEKVGQPKITINGNASKPNIPAGADNNNYEIPGSQKEDVKGIQENDNITSDGKEDNAIVSGTCPSDLMSISESACVFPVNSVEKTSDDKTLVYEPSSYAKLEKVPSCSDKFQAMASAQDGNLRLPNDEARPSTQPLEVHIKILDSKESHGDETKNGADKLSEREVVRDNPPELAVDTSVMNQGGSSSARLHAFNWVGDPTQVLDDKIYYASCRINGHSYRTMDHLLIQFENDKLIPSKLQAMWEDKNSTVKWVTVTRCYFPGDLPEGVGRPCGMERSEVFESTCGIKLTAGLIQSPCQVLPPRQFAEESDRRTRAGEQLNSCLPPLYLCKWIYDEAKGLFRDISC